MRYMIRNFKGINSFEILKTILGDENIDLEKINENADLEKIINKLDSV